MRVPTSSAAPLYDLLERSKCYVTTSIRWTIIIKGAFDDSFATLGELLLGFLFLRSLNFRINQLVKAKVSVCHIAFWAIFNKFACIRSLQFLRASEHGFHRGLGNVLYADVTSFLIPLGAFVSVIEALAPFLTFWINSGLKEGLIVRQRNGKNITSVVCACLRWLWVRIFAIEVNAFSHISFSIEL